LNLCAPRGLYFPPLSGLAAEYLAICALRGLSFPAQKRVTLFSM
jgi:hypothetical protein